MDDHTRIPPRAVVHQEGVVALLAVAGLGLRDGTPLTGLAPRGGLVAGLGAGLLAALVLSAALWGLERSGVPGMARLVAWQRRLVSGWGPAEAMAVAVFSGLAEEAFVRALLQPWIGLVPAALVFGLLHLPPSREAWFWPVMAFGLGIALGLVFARWGYPAAAAAHAGINALGFLRLLRGGAGDGTGV